jgi:Uma2 family endonuclease
MSSQTKPRLTRDEYLAFERTSELKHEFLDGEIFAMSGANERHNLIVASAVASLYAQLRSRPCKVYPSDMRRYQRLTVPGGLSEPLAKGQE